MTVIRTINHQDLMSLERQLSQRVTHSDSTTRYFAAKVREFEAEEMLMKPRSNGSFGSIASRTSLVNHSDRNHSQSRGR